MSPDLPPVGVVRSAAAVNEDIRRLWQDPRVRLAGDRRAEYERLIAEWAAAVRAEVAQAA